jgi:hypothetical protein
MSLSRKGIPKSEKHRDNMGKSLAKNYILISPEGIRYEGNNLSKFCEIREISAISMASVCRGVNISHKGWTGKYVE